MPNEETETNKIEEDINILSAQLGKNSLKSKIKTVSKLQKYIGKKIRKFLSSAENNDENTSAGTLEYMNP